MINQLRIFATRLTASVNTLLLLVAAYITYGYGGSTTYLMFSVGAVVVNWLSVVFAPAALGTRLLVALNGVVQVSLLVAAMQGQPAQMDYHLFYMAWLAVLVLYLDWRVQLWAFALIMGHHIFAAIAEPHLFFFGEMTVSRIAVQMVAFGIMSGVLIWFSRSLEQLLSGLSESNKGIANIAQSLDLSTRLPVNDDGEAGHLAQSVNTLLERLQSVLAQVRNSTGVMGHAVGELNQSAIHIAEQSSTQMGELKGIMHLTTDISHSIREVAGHVRQHAQSAQGLNDIAKQLDDTITGLQNQSKEIITIAQMIASVADQTNLLALNASIEAARAGDAGRGFAVVADEVRKLASNTNDSATHIREQIDALQHAMAVAIDQTRQMQEGITLMASTSHTMDSLMQTSSTGVQTMAETMQKFENGLQSVVVAIDQSRSASGKVYEETNGLITATNQFKTGQ
jgi:methyl-accepting chemotaxis protein